MRNSKNRYFYHIFVSPKDTPGAITLNVVWVEREFDAYKLPRCMCPSNYNRFWDTARYLWKNRHFIIPPLHSTPPLGEGGFPSEYRHLLWDGKTRIMSLPDDEKISKICLFVLTWSTNVTDGRTRQTLHDSKDRACIASRGKNSRSAGIVPAPILPKMGRSRPKFPERCHPLTCPRYRMLTGSAQCVSPNLFRKHWFFGPKSQYNIGFQPTIKWKTKISQIIDFENTGNC